MAEGPTRRAGCFKIGCFGCGAVTLLTVLIFGTLIGVGAFVGVPDPRVEETSIEQPVPPASTTGLPVAPTDTGGPLIPPGGLVPEVDEPGRVILDLAMGEFELVAGDEPGPIRIESRFDTAVFELVTEFERYGESGWIYRIGLERRIGWYRMLFHFEDHENFVRIVLPPDVPLSLEGSVGMGEVRMKLGGLWIVETDLVANMGEFTIDFDEPMLAPMRDFRFSSRMGDSRIRSLGNASPGSVSVKHRMGAMSLGLVGAWQNDAEVVGGIGMGELVVWVPEDVHVDVENMTQIVGASSVVGGPMLEELDEDAPTLRLDLSGGLGSLEVRHWTGRGP